VSAKCFNIAMSVFLVEKHIMKQEDIHDMGCYHCYLIIIVKKLAVYNVFYNPTGIYCFVSIKLARICYYSSTQPPFSFPVIVFSHFQYFVK